MTDIKIINGFYRLDGAETNIAGTVFPMVQPFKVGSNGGYVTVDSRSVPGFPDRNIRIKCDSIDDYEVLDFEGQTITPETDDEIKARLATRFEVLEQMTRAVKRGDVTAMIVSGPPGVGKSHGIEHVMQRYDLMESLGVERKYEVVKGNMSSLGLYAKLYEYRAHDNVLIFDDCDSVFEDPLSLNILKAALDSKKDRRINWNTDSNKLRAEDIPNSFLFQGSAIFVTNVKFSNVRSKKLRDHIEALESRCHYIDLTIDTPREKIIRIKQVLEGGMLDHYGFSDTKVAELLEYVETNADRFRELSLRTVVKLADLAKTFESTWHSVATMTLFK